MENIGGGNAVFQTQPIGESFGGHQIVFIGKQQLPVDRAHPQHHIMFFSDDPVGGVEQTAGKQMVCFGCLAGEYGGDHGVKLRFGQFPVQTGLVVHGRFPPKSIFYIVSLRSCFDKGNKTPQFSHCGGC